ncbi:MAG TPA: PAS domain S-box protein [bacterium]|nr:PAS domain S-box protein [bacterium]
MHDNEKEVVRKSSESEKLRKRIDRFVRDENSLELLINVLDKTTEAVGISTPEGKHYYQNAAFDRLFGMVGENPPESAYVNQAIGKQVFETLTAGNDWQGELKFYNRENDITDVFVQAFPVRDREGRIIGLVGIYTDITAIKRAKEEQHRVEERYRRVVETQAEMIACFLADGTMTFVNSAWQQYYRQRLGIDYDVIGKNIGDLMQLQNFDQVFTYLKTLQPGHVTVKMERSLFDLSGEECWQTWRIHRIDNAGKELIEFQAVGIDITEQKRAEFALQRQLKFEKGIASSSACLMRTGNEEGNINDALSFLREAADAARVYLFENFEDPEQGLCSRQLYESCAPGVPPEIDNPLLQCVPYAAGLARWREMLSNGRSISGFVGDFPAEEREILEPQGIISLLALPYCVGGQWRGFVGFDETRSRRVWREEEVSLLGTAADLIGAYQTRLQIEKSLRESESRFKGLFKQAPLSIQIFDADGKVIQANRKWEELWGIRFEDSSGYNILKDKQLSEFSAFDELKNVFAGEARDFPPVEYSAERTVGKGRTRWVQVRAYPVKDEAGNVREVTLIHEDVTEQRAAQAQLLRTKFAMDRAQDGILWIGDGGEIVYANDSSCTSLGYTREELLRMRIFDIDPDFPEAEWDQHKKEMRRLSRLNFESRHKTKDGRIFPVEVNSNIFGEEKEFLACAFDRDISERKQAEAALRESEKRFRLLVQNSNDIIQIMDPLGVASYISDQVTRILGYAPEELVGKQLFDMVHPDDQAAALNIISEGLPHLGAVGEAEYRFRHKDGSWVYLEAIGCNLLADPAVGGIVLNIRDVSERKMAEEEQRKLQDQLQQAMKMEAVGRLAGGVAHDFNNLLTGISGNVQLAMMDLNPDDPLAESLAEIGKAAESASSLIRQLLAFSRKQMISPKVINLNELISSMHKILVRLIGEDVQLRTTPGKSLAPVKIDPGQFEQILANLAVNARDAMPDGGKLTIETSNVELDEEYCRLHSYAHAGPYVMLAVSDTGIGMSKEVMEHLFEPFFTTKEKGKGTGLGLATIYGTVKQAGGNVEAYSEPGQGSTFKIYLPAVNEKAETLREPEGVLEMAGGTETILLVEDEEIVRNLAVRVLERLRYKVLAAAGGGDALILAERHPEPIHLLFTDVVMPGMNGRQLADRLATIHPETKVLYSSGYTENAVAHHGVIDKDLHFIGKPYSPRMLAETIRKVLDEKE